MLTIAFTRSGIVRALRSATPYSVTTYCTSVRGVVMTAPEGRFAMMRDDKIDQKIEGIRGEAGEPFMRGSQVTLRLFAL